MTKDRGKPTGRNLSETSGVTLFAGQMKNKRIERPMSLPATASPPVITYTCEEYLALDEAAPEGRRYEFDGTYVWAMAGARPEHNQLAQNVGTALHTRLRKRGCHVMQSDQRVHLGLTYVYPDVVAFCEKGRYTDENPPSLLNPALVVEVLSPSTLEKDLTWKLEAYRSVAPIQECWFLWTDEAKVDQYIREDDAWRIVSFRGEDATLRSPFFEIEVSLSELYELVL